MSQNQKNKILRTVAQLCLACAVTAPLTAGAELLDSIDINRADGMAVIKITLSHNVRYRRHFPQDRGNILNIYFDDVALESEGPTVPQRPGQAPPDTLSHDTQREEYLRSPPSDLVPFFEVAYLRNESGNSGFEPYYIAVRFSQTVNFSLRADEDNRAFYIFVPIHQHQTPTNGSTAAPPVKAGRGAAPVIPSPAPAVTRVPEIVPTPAISTTPASGPAPGSAP